MYLYPGRKLMYIRVPKTASSSLMVYPGFPFAQRIADKHAMVRDLPTETKLRYADHTFVYVRRPQPDWEWSLRQWQSSTLGATLERYLDEAGEIIYTPDDWAFDPEGIVTNVKAFDLEDTEALLRYIMGSSNDAPLVGPLLLLERLNVTPRRRGE